MPRIPTDELERVKQDIALERLVESAGIELKRHGKDLIGRCPFHDDKTPSLVVSPDKNLWHCLGACQTGGSVIDWVMKMQGVSFRHAVELLRDNPSLAASSLPVKQSTVRALSTPVAMEADDKAALLQVVDYYHRTLKENPEALAYLGKRGIASREAIEHFKLGYANRTLGLRLPLKNRKEGSLLRSRLQRLGVMRGSGHEHFAGCLVFPVVDESGHVTEMYGRKINKVTPGLALHLYLPGPHQGVWNLDALRENKEIILCEAVIDALTFWVAGYRNVTASYGVEGFTADHLRLFKHYGIERVLIAYDRDEAGEHAAKKLSETLLREGMGCYRIQFPKGMDANGYALSVQPVAKSLGVVIRSAVWLGNGSAPALTTHSGYVDEPSSTACDIEAVTLPAAVTDEPLPPLPASPLPEAPKVDLAVDVQADQILIGLGERRYRVRGLAQNPSLYPIKVNVLVSRGDAFHADTFAKKTNRVRSRIVTFRGARYRPPHGETLATGQTGSNKGDKQQGKQGQVSHCNISREALSSAPWRDPCASSSKVPSTT